MISSFSLRSSSQRGSSSFSLALKISYLPCTIYREESTHAPDGRNFLLRLFQLVNNFASLSIDPGTLLAEAFDEFCSLLGELGEVDECGKVGTGALRFRMRHVSGGEIAYFGSACESLAEVA